MSARKVCVVGAGPAGIISVAALVQRKCSVVWVGTAEGFAGTGRLGRFSNVIVFKLRRQNRYDLANHALPIFLSLQLNYALYFYCNIIHAKLMQCQLRNVILLFLASR